MEVGRSRADRERMPGAQGSRVTAYTVRIRPESCELTLHDSLSVGSFFGGLVHKEHLMQVYDSSTDSLLIQAMWCPHWCKTVQHRLPCRIPREGEPESMVLERIVSFQNNVGMILQAKVMQSVDKIVRCILGQAKTPVKIRRLDLFFMLADGTELLFLFCAGGESSNHSVPLNISGADKTNVKEMIRDSFRQSLQQRDSMGSKKSDGGKMVVCPSCLNPCERSQRYKVGLDAIIHFFQTYPFPAAVQKLERNGLRLQGHRYANSAKLAEQQLGEVLEDMEDAEVRRRGKSAKKSTGDMIAKLCCSADGQERLFGLRSALVKEEDEKTDPVRFFPGELSPAMEVIYQMLRIEFMQDYVEQVQRGSKRNMEKPKLPHPPTRLEFRRIRNDPALLKGSALKLCDRCVTQVVNAKTERIIHTIHREVMPLETHRSLPPDLEAMMLAKNKRIKHRKDKGMLEHGGSDSSDRADILKSTKLLPALSPPGLLPADGRRGGAGGMLDYSSFQLLPPI